MALTQRLVLRVPRRGKSPEVASFLAQLDDLSKNMFTDLADAKPAELAWQPKPGMNTIGMLLAHNAIVEAYWLLLATEVESAAEADTRLRELIGVDGDTDGMPAPKGGKPPRALAGWTIARYRALHDRARGYAKRAGARLTPAALDKPRRLLRPNGSVRIANPRWILYHVLEHQAGHYGQMLLLRHMYRERRRK